LQGASYSAARKRRYEEAKTLIEQQEYVLSFDLACADRASEIGSELRAAGKEIEIRDLFNASICLCNEIPLLTRNKKHYQRVSNLKLILPVSQT
jgi:tRNA(fMet)-specific endonuclease VapC